MTQRIYLDIPFAIFVSTLTTTSFADFIPQKIATGGYHSCALSTEGAIKCWGYNYYNQLGTGDSNARGSRIGTMGANLPAIDLGLNNTDKVVDICAGQIFTCALTQEGQVKCFGDNRNGQLGQGRSFERDMAMGKALPFTDLGKNFKVKAITCGETHACALSDQGLVKCWGNGTYGALGLGNKTTRGSRPEDMGDNLPAIAGLTNIQGISAGGNYSCAVSAEGLRCWGRGREGQLGLENASEIGTTPETIPSKSPLVNLFADPNEKILSITASDGITCALMTKIRAINDANTFSSPQDADSSFVKCWGENRSGYLGTGDTISYGLKSGTMGAALPRLNLALDNIVSLNAHARFTCALSKSGRVKCWGLNVSGRLGLGDEQARGAQPSDMGKNLPDVNLGLPAKAISTGSLSVHSCAILINNQIKCWGYNDAGQLGYENTTDLGAMASDMGDALPFVRFK